MYSERGNGIETLLGMLQDEFKPPPGYNCGLYCCHDALSKVSEKRKACMPYDGTLDFPVLFIITAMNLIALIYGATTLAREGEIISLRGTEEQNVKMIALVFALVEVTPGFLYLWYACPPEESLRHMYTPWF